MQNKVEFAVLLVLGLAFTGVLLVYMLYPRKETFATGAPSSFFSAYKDPTMTTPEMTDKATSQQMIGYEDVNDLLHMRRCYQFPGFTIEDAKKAFKNKSGSNPYIVSFDMVTCNFQDVESKIVCELGKFHEKNLCRRPVPAKACNRYPQSSLHMKEWKPNSCPMKANAMGPDNIEITCNTKVQGPIYVLLFQAPYYRDDKGQTMALQFNTSSYNGSPFYNMSQENTPIYYHVVMMFSRYDTQMKVQPIDVVAQVIIPIYDKMLFSKEAQCFLRLKNHPTRPGQVGGCSSTHPTKRGNTPYAATCLGPVNPRNAATTDERHVTSSYAILYKINSNHNLISKFVSNESSMVPISSPQCGTFSESKFRAAYQPDLTKYATAYQHWAQNGAMKGQMAFLEEADGPGFFDPAAYLRLYPDVQKARMNPLQHVKNFAWKEKRKVCLHNPMQAVVDTLSSARR